VEPESGSAQDSPVRSHPTGTVCVNP
jgi:hypothetical protein